MLHDLSYLAGLIDGEGSVGFHSRGAGKTKRFVIKINMTDESVIDWLRSTFGGYKHLRPRVRPNWKDQWLWQVQNAEAKALYEQVRPLLKIKNTVDLSAASNDGG